MAEKVIDRINVPITPDLKQRLEARANELDISQAALVRRAIRMWFQLDEYKF